MLAAARAAHWQRLFHPCRNAISLMKNHLGRDISREAATRGTSTPCAWARPQPSMPAPCRGGPASTSCREQHTTSSYLHGRRRTQVPRWLARTSSAPSHNRPRPCSGAIHAYYLVNPVICNVCVPTGTIYPPMVTPIPPHPQLENILAHRRWQQQHLQPPALPAAPPLAATAATAAAAAGVTRIRTRTMSLLWGQATPAAKQPLRQHAWAQARCCCR